MTQSWNGWCLQLGLASSLVISGAIADLGDCALAQITPDTTLGSENSTVTSIGEVDQINGRATRGANLFHSFQEFNAGEGREAYFANPAGIENILSRVTGNDPSDIFGKLGVLGNANLILINPKGIIFGPNASLDVGDSFVATIANAIEFGNQGFFSASVPNILPPTLTINPSAFLFNQIANQQINSIENRGILSVPAGQSLLLLGGNVSPSVASTGRILIDGGTLQAPGGRVELGAVAGAGTVGLSVDGNNLSLSFSDAVARADVSLTNGSLVNVVSGGGGSIGINVRNLNILGGSTLSAGIGSGLGSVDSQAGDIRLNAKGAIAFDGDGIVNCHWAQRITTTTTRGAAHFSGRGQWGHVRNWSREPLGGSDFHPRATGGGSRLGSQRPGAGGSDSPCPHRHTKQFLVNSS